MSRSYALFDPVVSRYIQERLIAECRVRGVRRAIALATGYTVAHVSLVTSGRRGVGEDFALAVAKYWGLSHIRLRDLAHAHFKASGGLVPELATHPNLDATLDWCTNIYPNEFLRDYERGARRYQDKPKQHWLMDLHAHFTFWLEEKPKSLQRKYMEVLTLATPNYQVEETNSQPDYESPGMSPRPEQSETRTISDEPEVPRMSSTPEPSRAVPMAEQALVRMHRKAR